MLSACAFLWPYQCTETESILMVYVTELKDWTRLQSSYVYFDWKYIWYGLTQECIGANVICQYSATVKLSPFWFQVHFMFSYSYYLLSNSIIYYYSLVIDMLFLIPTRLTGRAWGACQQGKGLAWNNYRKEQADHRRALQAAVNWWLRISNIEVLSSEKGRIMYLKKLQCYFRKNFVLCIVACRLMLHGVGRK
jgi:hypothetical protein